MCMVVGHLYCLELPCFKPIQLSSGLGFKNYETPSRSIYIYVVPVLWRPKLSRTWFCSRRFRRIENSEKTVRQQTAVWRTPPPPNFTPCTWSLVVDTGITSFTHRERSRFPSVTIERIRLSTWICDPDTTVRICGVYHCQCNSPSSSLPRRPVSLT